MILRHTFIVCFAAILAIAAVAAPSAAAVEVDFDVALIIVDDYLASGPNLRHADNDGNGIYEDDQLGMLSIILQGGPGVACLNAGMVSAIQAGFAQNLTATRSELTVNVGSQGTVDLLNQLQQTDAQLGTALQNALAGMLTIADTATLAYVNQLADLAVVQVLSNTPESGSIGSVQNQINFTAAEYKTFGNAPAEPNYLGPAGDLDGDGDTNLEEYFDGIVQNSRETWLVDNCLPAPLRVTDVTGGGLRVTGVPELFSVATAGGVAPPTFQWRKGTTSSFTVLSTNANYTIPFLTGSNSGNYYCVVTDGVTTRQTPIRNLNVVFVPLFFALQPLGASKSVGRAHTFSVRVQGGVGPGPYTYTWRRNGAIVGPNAADFTIPSITVADAGNYTCTVSSNGGADAKVSNAATLSVAAGAFSLVSQPASVDAYLGNPLTLSVVISGGSGVFTYEWRKNGATFGAPSSPNLTFNSLVNGDAATYTCTVRDTVADAQVVTDPAVVRVQSPLVITTQPVSAQVYVGDLVQFNVAATGGYTPLSYQWRWNSLPIQGSTSANYASVATLQFPGNFSCVVTDANGTSVISQVATLGVFPRLVIQNPPQGGNFYVDESHALIVNATGGNGTLTYEWIRDGETVPGAATLALAFANLQESDSGEYQCVVRDAFNAEVITDPVTLQVGTLPEITLDPQSANLYTGEPYTMGLLLEGGLAPVTYQWRKGGILLPQETGPAFNIASASPAVAGVYQCTVRDARDTTLLSAEATLTVSPRLALTTGPQPQTLYAGGTLSLAVAATGGIGTRHYTWYRDGNPVSAPDAPQLTINPAQTGDTGLYGCVITDDRDDTIVTEQVPVLVGEPPVFLTQPADVILNEGDRLELTAQVAGGVGDLAYTWRRDGDTVATGPDLVIDPLTLEDGGDYACTVADALSEVDGGVLLRLSVLPVDPGDLTRVTDGIQVLYTFDPNEEGIVPDRSGVEPPIDLFPGNPAAVRQLEPAGLAIESPTRLLTDATTNRLGTALRDANALTLEAWIRPAQSFTFSEARVVALAASRQQRSVTLSQLLDRYEYNLRSSTTTAAGVPAITLNQSVNTQALWHVVYTRAPGGAVALYVNGAPAGTGTVSGNLSGWDVAHVLTLANDPDGQAPWLGDLHLVALYNRALSAQEALRNFLVGPNPNAPEEEGEGGAEGEFEGQPEGEGEGSPEGQSEGEGQPEGAGEGQAEGEIEGQSEGEMEGQTEGEGEGQPEGEGEGQPEGEGEGQIDGEGDGEGEGQIDGEGDGEGEGQIDGEGDGEEEGQIDGEGDGEGEGQLEGDGEGEGEGQLEGEGEPVDLGDEAHSADQDRNARLSLSELLRVIQFYNSPEYGCDDASEDGFAPNGGDKGCGAHASDYNPQDWKVSLSELLRVIQFYNAGGYRPCPGSNSEDGYCPGPGPA
jgi:hypothetical protein